MMDKEEKLKIWQSQFEQEHKRKPNYAEYNEAKQRIQKELELDELRARQSNTASDYMKSSEGQIKASRVTDRKKKRWPLIVGLVALLVIFAGGAFALGTAKNNKQAETSSSSSSIKESSQKVSNSVSKKFSENSSQSSESNSNTSTSSSSTAVDTKNLTEAQAEAWIWHHYNNNGSTQPGTTEDGIPVEITNTGQSNGNTYFNVSTTQGTDQVFYRVNSSGVLQSSWGMNDSDDEWTTEASSYDAN